MAHRLEPGVIAVELPGHGEFATTIDAVRSYQSWTKRELARELAEVYSDGQHGVTYWLTYPRTILEVVLGGCCVPRN